MDNQGLYLPFAADPEFFCHFLCHRQADDQISQVLEGPFFRFSREAQNIGSLVDSAVFPVQPPHDAVVDVGDGEALCLGSELLPKSLQKRPQGPFPGPPKLASGRPINFEFNNFSIHFDSLRIRSLV
nr:hypothetical protein [Holophaga foetida]